MKWGVFLDRDGVINEDEEGFISDPARMKLLPGAAAAVKRLREAGALIIVVTNQPAVARGKITEEGLAAIHGRMEKLLEEQGARLDAVYYCPHHPETHHPEADDPRYRRDCDCRKPKDGMLRRAASRFGLAPSRCFMVGDSTADLLAAKNFGCRSVLVETGNAGKDGRYQAESDAVCPGVFEAADWIISQTKSL
jgi:histidinol-phosphate phosphatase family protein